MLFYNKTNNKSSKTNGNNNNKQINSVFQLLKLQRSVQAQQRNKYRAVTGNFPLFLIKPFHSFVCECKQTLCLYFVEHLNRILE